jgi:hypothetical protein
VGHDILHARNRAGRTPLELARHLGRAPLVEFLQEVEVGTLLPGMAQRKRRTNKKRMESPRASPRYAAAPIAASCVTAATSTAAAAAAAAARAPSCLLLLPLLLLVLLLRRPIFSLSVLSSASRRELFLFNHGYTSSPRGDNNPPHTNDHDDAAHIMQAPVVKADHSEGISQEKEVLRASKSDDAERTLPALVRMYTRGSGGGARDERSGAKYRHAVADDDDDGEAAGEDSDELHGAAQGQLQSQRVAKSLFTMTFSRLPGLQDGGPNHRRRRGNPAAARARTDALMGVQFPLIAPQPKALRAAQRKCAVEHRRQHLKAARDIRFAGYTATAGRGPDAAAALGGSSTDVRQKGGGGAGRQQNEGTRARGGGAVLGLTQAFDSSMMLTE